MIAVKLLLVGMPCLPLGRSVGAVAVLLPNTTTRSLHARPYRAHKRHKQNYIGTISILGGPSIEAASRAKILPNTTTRTFHARSSRARQQRSKQKYLATIRIGPSIEAARAMPLSFMDMENASLVALGGMGNHHARTEMVKRHIMSVDDCSYPAACWKFLQIEEKNHADMYLLALPFQVGLASAVGAGFISVPMVFHLPTVEFFNEHFVTAEHPPMKELETALEVGSWSWNWMEPPLGVSTFVLLCLQYMRMHLNHLGFQPYTDRLKRVRGRRLVAAFPQYDPGLLSAYSESSTIYNQNEDTRPDRAAYKV